MAFDNHMQRGYPIVFGLILFFSAIELAISAWLTARFSARHDYFSTDERDRTHFILFSSIWTVVPSTIYLVLFVVLPSTVMRIVLFHIILLVLTWIFWTAGAASVTSMLSGGLNCSDTVFVYCNQLNAMEAFAWLTWIVVTFLLIVVAICGILAARRSSGSRPDEKEVPSERQIAQHQSLPQSLNVVRRPISLVPRTPPQQPALSVIELVESQPRPQHYEDQIQSDQHNEHDISLRAKAKQEGALMAQCYEQSQEAYRQGDGALAKELSQKGGAHKHRMESLNAEACARIFRENNLNSKPGEVNLRGLYVKEAITFSEEAIVKAQSRGDAEIRFIVGKGLHSVDHVPKIKPALEEFLKNRGLPSELDPNNGGVLVVRLR